MMKERPILFSSPMVRALLNGSKTQTRRVVSDRHTAQIDLSKTPCRTFWSKPMPYGQPGDRLWVRETWAYGIHAMANNNHEAEGPWVYAADNPKAHGRLCDRWRPSIHMFRSASRITLEVTSVRVERLQDISEADAIAEGICELPLQAAEPGCWWTADAGAGAALHGRTPCSAYRLLWDSINGTGSWEANPWVWVIEWPALSNARLTAPDTAPQEQR